MRIKYLLSTIFLLAILLALSAPSAPMTPTTTRVQTDWGQMPLYFIANQGQMDARVAYYVQGNDKTLYFTPQGITFALTGLTANHPEGEKNRWIVNFDFVQANPVRPIGQDRTGATISYFKGSREQWRTGLPTYAQIIYRDLWDGIDLVYRGTAHRLKYEFVVQPGADPAQIRLAYRGATLRVNDTGQLEVNTPAGGFQDETPVAYQEANGERVPIAVEYMLDDATTYGFHVGAYNPALPLVIDPAVLVYCGYIGGSNWEESEGIAVDAAGNAYIIGDTASTETSFPVTVGPDLTSNSNDEVFVAKVKADGTGLVYAGYIGGSGNDYGWGIAVDAAGNAYIAGETNSTQATFPVTVGPDLTHNGGYDAFVARVKADGTGLDYCGYIGGSSNDYAHHMALDAAGNVYLTGDTASTETSFPVTVGPDTTYNGGTYDGFVAKVTADGTGLVYAGYIGGNNQDEAWNIDVDAAGNAYLTGGTTSSEATFPVAVGPDLTYNGGEDGFVAKVKADGTGLVYAGYIGGSGDDYGWGIAVDAAGNAYISGETGSTAASFPVAVGPDLTHNGGDDAFVARVKADGTGLDYCGYIGGNGRDYAHRNDLDSTDNLYLVGATNSTEATFPVTNGPDLTYNGGLLDGFVAKVTADGTGLVYAGYIGGDGDWDFALDIATDSAGNAYITGITDSSETFPVTVGPNLTYNGNWDAFVAKVSVIELNYKSYLPLILK
ncbi:MAG: SBBP repeat-containing protein [Anaerolineae bacterium]|nr:SBBP repeat-containing protein [Anaerolineae bacterium]